MTREGYYDIEVEIYDNYTTDYGARRCVRKGEDAYMVYWESPEDYIDFFIDEHSFEWTYDGHYESYVLSIYDAEHNFVMHRQIYFDEYSHAVIVETLPLVR